MARNKSPGNDGLSSELYLKFWNIIGNFDVTVLKKGLNKREWSCSQRQTVIDCERRKDRCLLKNGTINGILEYTKYKNIPGIMLCLDFEKAFDTLEWGFLFKTVQRMNFGSTFVNLVKTLYSNV